MSRRWSDRYANAAPDDERFVNSVKVINYHLALPKRYFFLFTYLYYNSSFFYRLSSLIFMRWLLLWGCQFLLLSLAYFNSCPWSLWCLEMSQFTTLLVCLERTFIRPLTPTTLLLTGLWSSVTIFLYFLSVFSMPIDTFILSPGSSFFETFILSFWVSSCQKYFTLSLCSGVWIDSPSHDKNVQPRSQLPTTCYRTGGSR